MGKRSDFERVELDFYPTPLKAVEPLAPFLPDYFTYVEPCAGDGAIIRHMDRIFGEDAECVGAYDIQPAGPDIIYKNALELTEDDINGADYIITNPPWDRTKKSGYLLHNLIETFANLAPTWLLFDADWMHTLQSEPYVRKYLLSIVSIGRVKWIEDSTMTGKDNCAWYLFDKNARSQLEYPEFFGRNVTL